jgi:hypothetical protein
MNQKQFLLMNYALHNNGKFYTYSINKEWNDLVNKGYATKDDNGWDDGMSLYRVTEHGMAARSHFATTQWKRSKIV